MGVAPKQPKRSCFDVISTLPQHIIENILCLVPIQDAARTSILSRGWRYNWTKIPRLEFNSDTFQVSTSVIKKRMYTTGSERIDMTKRCKMFYAIYQVWIMHQGPIHEFTLSIEADDTCIEIDQAIFHLSKNNTVKRFTLDVRKCCNYTVPLSFFSLHQLTHIDLRNCRLYEYARLKTSSNAFPKLTSLYLEDVKTSLNMIQCLISDSTSLKSFTLIHRNYGYIGDHPLYDLTIYYLFEFLPVIEHLTISVIPVKFYARSDAVPRELPTSLVHLKYICLEGMCFNSEYGLPFLALLIRSSPNLKKIKIVMAPKHGKIDSVALEDHTDICLEHLSEFEIKYFGSEKPELEFVKLILAKSPVLKKVSILLDCYVDVNKELKMLKALLKSPRASPMADINVDRLPIKIKRSFGSVIRCC